MSTNDTILVRIASTATECELPSTRIAVSVPVYQRLAAESGHPSNSLGHLDELTIALDGEDGDILDGLDDNLRERGQALTEFRGGECYALFVDDGPSGEDVWARVRVPA